MEIYTIGHSNHAWETFAPLLKMHGIETLVDVRSKPVSRFAPFSNIKRFPGLLESEGIKYVFMGDTLGGRPDDPFCYDVDGKPDYSVMRTRPIFKHRITELVEIARDATAVIMCSEENPMNCHRTLLIGPGLQEFGVALLHIRKGGAVQASAML
jgi:uncharacterized protein (DUF488 family)